MHVRSMASSAASKAVSAAAAASAKAAKTTRLRGSQIGLALDIDGVLLRGDTL